MSTLGSTPFGQTSAGAIQLGGSSNLEPLDTTLLARSVPADAAQLQKINAALRVQQAAASQGIRLSMGEAARIAPGLAPGALSVLKVASGATFGAVLSVLLDAKPAGNASDDYRAGFRSLSRRPEQTPIQLGEWVASWSPEGADNPTRYQQLDILRNEFMSSMSRAKAGDVNGLTRATGALRTWWEGAVGPLDDEGIRCISRIVGGYLRHLTGSNETSPAKPPTQPKPEPTPVPSAISGRVELTPPQRSEAEAQGAFKAQIAFNEAAKAGLDEAIGGHRRGYSRVGGLVSQLYHKIGAGEAGLGEIKIVRDQLQAQWNQMSNAANALNRSNGEVDLLKRANSNAQSLCKQWPALRQDPNASAWLKKFDGDLSNAKAWSDSLKGYAGGLRNFITATDRYIQQADAYRQGKGPKPTLPDFRLLANSGLAETPATRAAVNAMFGGYAAASEWLSHWVPRGAQPASPSDVPTYGSWIPQEKVKPDDGFFSRPLPDFNPKDVPPADDEGVPEQQPTQASGANQPSASADNTEPEAASESAPEEGDTQAKPEVDRAVERLATIFDAYSGQYKLETRKRVEAVAQEVEAAASAEGISPEQWLDRQDPAWLQRYNHLLDRVQAAHRDYSPRYVNSADGSLRMIRPSQALKPPSTTQQLSITQAADNLQAALDAEPADAAAIRQAHQQLMAVLGANRPAQTLRQLPADQAQRVRELLTRADTAR
jgi:hypothetical protein